MENVQWVVLLSDGSLVKEHENGFTWEEGAETPWRRLLDHVEANNLHVRSMGLMVNGLWIGLPPRADFYVLNYMESFELTNGSTLPSFFFKSAHEGQMLEYHGDNAGNGHVNLYKLDPEDPMPLGATPFHRP